MLSLFCYHSAMAKQYDIRCPVARTLNALGDGWSVLILRDLFLNKSCRFQEFQQSLKNIVPSTLSQRLKKLEADKLIERKIYNEHPIRVSYRLTKKGKTLGPVLLALKDWGEKNV